MANPLTGTVLLGTPFGLAVGPDGNVYVADSQNNVIRELFVLSGSFDTIATGFNFPCGISVGTGTFVADSTNNVIKRLVADEYGNGQVITLAGSGIPGWADGASGSAQFYSPTSVAQDPTGNVWVADFGNHVIRRIDSAGNVSTFAGSGQPGLTNGSGSAAQFANPFSISIDAGNNLYVGEFGNHVVRKIDPSGNVTTLAGTGVVGYADGTAATAQFTEIVGIVSDPAGVNIYVSDWGNNRIRQITGGNVTTLTGDGNPGKVDGTGGAVGTAQFTNPGGLGLDNFGNLYVADVGNNAVRKVVISSGATVTLIGGSGAGYVDWGSIPIFLLPAQPLNYFRLAQFPRGIKFANVPLGRADQVIVAGGSTWHVNTVESVIQRPSDQLSLSGVIKFRPRGMRASIVQVPVKVR